MRGGGVGSGDGVMRARLERGALWRGEEGWFGGGVVGGAEMVG